MGDSPGDALDLVELCRARGWTRGRLLREMRIVARRDGQSLPGDDSLKRMIRLWANGTRAPGSFYASLLVRTLSVPLGDNAEVDGDLLSLLDRAQELVDEGLAQALEAQTQSLRILDRRLGGHRLMTQVQAHAKTVAELVTWAPIGAVRRRVAATGAEAAALAGWQALDLGRPKESWQLHEQARALAHESQDLSVIAHVTAQQAYALLDAGRAGRAIAQFEAARAAAATKVPGLVRAWLAAAEAESRAAAGDATLAARLLDKAQREPLQEDVIPYLVLDSSHLARWRGHCLARVGAPEAVTALSQAQRDLSPEFTRASAGLHADLAIAHRAGWRP